MTHVDEKAQHLYAGGCEGESNRSSSLSRLHKASRLESALGLGLAPYRGSNRDLTRPCKIRAVIRSVDMCRRTGATYRQVSNWTIKGYLVPEPRYRDGSGVYFDFHEREMHVAVLMAGLSSLDLLGNSSGAGFRRRSNWLAPLIDYVRTNGLVGEYDTGSGLIFDLDTFVRLGQWTGENNPDAATADAGASTTSSASSDPGSLRPRRSPCPAPSS